MALSTYIKLEEQELSKAETKMIQCFANDAAAEHSEDPLANALNLVVEQVPSVHRSQIVRENNISGSLSADHGDLPLDPARPELSSVNDDLIKVWQEFQHELDNEQRQKQLNESRGLRKLFLKIKSDRSSPRWRIDSKEGQPLGIQDIIKSIEDAESHWRSKPRLAHGRVQSGFHRFCRTLDTHSNLLEYLPSQNQYLSIFCGVTTTLIKASVNHQNVAEGLSEALRDISDSVAESEQAVRLMNYDDMHNAISSLYAYVFQFLASAMKWYQASARKKILDSLTENFSDSLQGQVSKIQDTCNRIRHKGYSKTQVEIRRISITGQETLEGQRKQGVSIESMRHKLDALGKSVEEGLRGATEAWLHKEEDSPPKHHFSDFSARRFVGQGKGTWTRTATSRRKAITTTLTTTRGQLQEWSAILEDFTTNTLDILNLIELSTAVVDHETVEVVRDWSQSSTSQALWVQGRFQETHPSNASTIAAKVINTVRKMAIPFLAFFFHVDDGTGEDLRTLVASPCESPEASMAVDCVYSLIRQLINQLPRDVELPGKNWKARFEYLDGSLKTFDIALKILEQLLQQAPATLLIIIDGVEQVDDSEAQQPVSEVLLLLQEMTTKTKEEKVVKTLYTTAGPSDVLEALDEDFLQCVEAEEGRLKHMKGRLQCIDDLELDSDANTARASSDSDEGFSE